MSQSKGYGCYNRAEYVEQSVVQDGWTDDGRRNMIKIPFRMRRDCDYTHTELGQKDERCKGCKWRK